MNSFASALEDFQNGSCSRQDLETLIDRNIDLGSPATEMLTQLEERHRAEPLETADLETIRRRIASAETRLRTRLRAAGEASTRRTAGVGDTLKERFVLEELIGSGGMSRVFKALDRRKVEARSRHPHVAVKVMTVPETHLDQAFVAMQREVQKSQSLTHQNIVRVNDFDRDGDVVFTTMELLEGESLQQRISRFRTDPLPLPEATRLIGEMARALAFAHANNILHADFKPSNAFITSRGVLKVIDFGIARGFHAEGAPLEQTVFDARDLGALTPAYASPEMIEDQEPHPRDDIYGLGCVAYELVTGVHPFGRLMATDARDNGLKPKRPDALSRVQWAALERTLRFERGDRTASVEEFLTAFERAKGRRGGRVVALAASLGALVVAAALFWVLRPQKPPSENAAPRESASAPVAPETPLPPGVVQREAPALVFRDCEACPLLRWVPTGSQTIGLAETDLPGMFEYPEHLVTIDTQYAMGMHEVTVGEFRAFAEGTGSDFAGCRTAADDFRLDPERSWRDPGFPQTDDHPVTCVSWQDAQAYLAWLNDRTAASYRLPSEAEWEYAARTIVRLPLQPDVDGVCESANTADVAAGEALDGMETATCDDGFAFTAPVTRHGAPQVPADMRGNVFEWTQDCWNPSYHGAPSDGSARTTGDCGSRTLRGGSWFSAPAAQRLTYRNRFPIDYRSNTFGFRIVKPQ